MYRLNTLEINTAVIGCCCPIVNQFCRNVATEDSFARFIKIFVNDEQRLAVIEFNL